MEVENVLGKVIGNVADVEGSGVTLSYVVPEIPADAALKDGDNWLVDGDTILTDNA